MTKQQYDEIKAQLEENYRQGMAALETIYAFANGRKPEPDLGPAPEVPEHRAGLDGDEANRGTLARSGRRKRTYKHTAEWLAKHGENES